jgi:filamentous hemagglutinin
VIFSAGRKKNDVGEDADVKMVLTGAINIGGGASGGKSGSVMIEGVRGYDGYTDTAVAGEPGSQVMTDYQSFVSNAASIAVRIANDGLTLQGGSAGVQISGGVELRSAGDMLVSTPWDLTTGDWMPPDTNVHGRLTLRAAGTLTVLSALGFPDDNLAIGSSWSIRLVGGGDLSAADAMAVKPLLVDRSSGDVVIGNRSVFTYNAPRTSGSWSESVGKVRTGTGSIQIAAGRDVVVEAFPTIATDGAQIVSTYMGIAPKATIYTAGQPVFDDSSESLYPTGGGDISIAAARNISGPGGQWEYVNDWLRRTSAFFAQGLPTTGSEWFIARDTFGGAAGTLGGGNVRISAGGDIAHFSVAAPTFGRVFDDNQRRNSIDVQGGGNIDVRAGGNLDGGEYVVGRGRAQTKVGGAVGETSAPAIYLMGQSSDPALRGATLRAIAGGDINIQNVSNPTMLSPSSIRGKEDFFGFDRFLSTFFTYDEASGVDLISVGGNLNMPGKQARHLAKSNQNYNLIKDNPVISDEWSDLLAPQFAATAFQGSITGKSVLPNSLPLRLYPTASSGLRLLADSSIATVAIEAADLNPLFQPQWGWNSPFIAALNQAPGTGTVVFGPQVINRLVTPSTSGSHDFVVASASGDLSDSAFSFSRQSWISAGRDLRNVRLNLQNLAQTDRSVVRAGRDIRYVPQFASGALDTENKGGYIRVGGAGRLLIEAGRNVDLGVTEGITAGGNNFNGSLPGSRSAALTVMAGVSGDISNDAVDLLFAELKTAGLAQNAAQGETAIRKVFNSGNTGPGSIAMFFSAIKTEGGSGIDLLVPGGDINAGLPTPGGGNIGVYTAFGGEIRTYLSGDFNVNQSKVATLDGGNILIYTANGNIDAGRGARDSRTTQPPQRKSVDDEKGNPTGLFAFIPPSDASGSGIRSLTFDPDGPGPLAAPKPGDIFLFAPKGFIDAGEAGVSSAGSIFVAALQVLNASNFSASGAAVGVPVTVNSGISVAAAGAGSVGASAAKSADEMSKTLASSASALGPKDIVRPSMITVELLGLGDDSCKDKQGCGEDVKGK